MAEMQTGCPIDLHCPGCKYNLRGLTRSRCPECGLEFRWEDLLRRSDQRSGVGRALLSAARAIGVAILVLAAVAACLISVGVIGLSLLAGGRYALVGPGVIVLPLLVAAIQTRGEILLLGGRRSGWSRRHARAWWEGTLIGYAAAAMTIWICGYAMVPIESSGIVERLVRCWLLMVLAFVPVVGVQYWVLRLRGRQWHELGSVSRLRLLKMCIAAKLASGAVWAMMPFAILPLEACVW